MKYLEVINNCKLKIEKEFKEFESTLKKNDLFSDLHSITSSYSFVNEFHLVDVTLSFHIPELKSADEDGIDISVELSQIRETKNGITSYTSNIMYDKNDDLVLGECLYVTSDISTTTGNFIFKNTDSVINIDDVYSLDKDLSNVIDRIFVSFRLNVNLMASKLLDLKRHS